MIVTKIKKEIFLLIFILKYLSYSFTLFQTTTFVIVHLEDKR